MAMNTLSSNSNNKPFIQFREKTAETDSKRHCHPRTPISEADKISNAKAGSGIK